VHEQACDILLEFAEALLGRELSQGERFFRIELGQLDTSAESVLAQAQPRGDQADGMPQADHPFDRRLLKTEYKLFRLPQHSFFIPQKL